MDVYKFTDYRKLINELANQNPTRGHRSRMSQAAGCSPSWMTRVLNSEVHLTPDQAAGLADYFHLDENETDYFLLLVDFERAATPLLRQRLDQKISSLRKQGRKLATSIRQKETMPVEQAARYYSSWTYAAIHVFTMIRPAHADEISQKLRLPLDLILRLLKEMREMNLINSQGSLWSASNQGVHLPSDHPNAGLMHALWRGRTIQHLQENREGGLHYSGIHCLSKEDAETIQALLKESILKCRKMIADSPSEALSVFCLDWYEI